MPAVPRLRALRERALLSQETLAKRANVAKTTINRLENEQHDARYVTIHKLAEALGVAPQALTAAPGESTGPLAAVGGEER